MGKQWKQWQTLFSWAPKSLWMGTTAMKLKDACSLEEKQWKPRLHIKKRRHYFADKGPHGQSCGFFGSHVWMWELDHKEDWAPKNRCFWTVVWEKMRVPWTTRRWNQSILKGISPEHTSEGLLLKLEAPILWPPDLKNWLIGKDPGAGNNWRQEEKGTKEDQMVGWHH